MTSPLTMSCADATASFPAGPWTLQPRISPNLVLPDRECQSSAVTWYSGVKLVRIEMRWLIRIGYTDHAAIAPENMPGKAVDPGR
jgi:hypothetical protein